MKGAPLVLVIVGLVLAGIFGIAAIITIVLMATSRGRISGEEAAPFIGGGCCCSSFGVLLIVIGLIIGLASRQRKP